MMFEVSSFNYSLSRREKNSIIEASSAEEAIERVRRSGAAGYFAEDFQARRLSEEEEARQIASRHHGGDGAYGGPNHDA